MHILYACKSTFTMVAQLKSHKPKTKKCYNTDFALLVTFQLCTQYSTIYAYTLQNHEKHFM